MPKYRARVSVTLPYKQRFSSISVSSEAEVENVLIDAARDEVQAFILADIESLLNKAFSANLETPDSPKSGPKKISK